MSVKTKDKIIIAALELFNEKGVYNTTIRNIAQKLNISSGNLNYHFTYKEEIIETLYFNFIEIIESRTTIKDDISPDLSFFYNAHSIKMEDMYSYRFIYRDLYELLSKNFNIRKHYYVYIEKRISEFLGLLTILQTKGIVKPEQFNNEYKRLYKRVLIITDNWINTLVVENEYSGKDIKYYTDLIFEMIYPYLTEKGIEEYNFIKNSNTK